jgi:Phosphotransferase enzyme family
VTPDPAPAVVEGVALAIGAAPERWTRIVGGGYSPAEHWLVELRDGSRAFVKVGATPLVAEWLRLEHRAYREISGSFMPRLIGWSDGEVPVLLLEDLTDAAWPPPWDADMVARVLACLDRVAATDPPRWAEPIEERREIFSGWTEVEADPEPFLSLGLVSRGWLAFAQSLLVEHERPRELEGTGLLHFDVRSDNMCFTQDRAMLVDWNHVGCGNPLFDVAGWLPSLAFEGGPAPEEVSPLAGVFAPALAGYFCSRAGLPVIPDAPRVRQVQLEQAMTSLPWAARWLGLPAPDGPRLTPGD